MQTILKKSQSVPLSTTAYNPGLELHSALVILHIVAKNECFGMSCKSFHTVCSLSKGQIKPKADCRVEESPKKGTNEQICFVCFLLFMANKTNLFVRFLGESMVRPNCFHFYLTFRKLGNSFFNLAVGVCPLLNYIT